MATKTKKKAKEPELIVAKEVDRSEFIDLLRGQIEAAEKSIKQAQQYINSFLNLYNKTERDKIHYNLKYYVVGDGLSYERSKRKKIGF